jgi:hypothetical protein
MDTHIKNNTQLFTQHIQEYLEYYIQLSEILQPPARQNRRNRRTGWLAISRSRCSCLLWPKAL